MNAALLGHKKLAEHFVSWGLVINPSKPCVWNKFEEQKELSIMFHVDDLLMRCMKPTTITEYVELLDKNYCSKDPLAFLQSKIHKHLHMTIDFSLKRRCAIS